MWKLVKTLFIEGVKMLLDLGHKPTREDAIDIARALLRDEFMARVVADEIDSMLSKPQGVLDAFKPDGSVPDLLDGLPGEVVMVCPVEGCSKREDHWKSGDLEHGVDL